MAVRHVTPPSPAAMDELHEFEMLEQQIARQHGAAPWEPRAAGPRPQPRHCAAAAPPAFPQPMAWAAPPPPGPAALEMLRDPRDPCHRAAGPPAAARRSTSQPLTGAVDRDVWGLEDPLPETGHASGLLAASAAAAARAEGRAPGPASLELADLTAPADARPASPGGLSWEADPSPGPSLSPEPSSLSAQDRAEFECEALMRLSPFQIAKRFMDMRLALAAAQTDLELLRALAHERETLIGRLRRTQETAAAARGAGAIGCLEREVIHLQGKLRLAAAAEEHYKRQSDELLGLAQGVVQANVRMACELQHYKQQAAQAGLPLLDEGEPPPTADDRPAAFPGAADLAPTAASRPAPAFARPAPGEAGAVPGAAPIDPPGDPAAVRAGGGGYDGPRALSPPPSPSHFAPVPCALPSAIPGHPRPNAPVRIEPAFPHPALLTPAHAAAATSGPPPAHPPPAATPTGDPSQLQWGGFPFGFPASAGLQPPSLAPTSSVPGTTASWASLAQLEGLPPDPTHPRSPDATSLTSPAPRGPGRPSLVHTPEPARVPQQAPSPNALRYAPGGAGAQNWTLCSSISGGSSDDPMTCSSLSPSALSLHAAFEPDAAAPPPAPRAAPAPAPAAGDPPPGAQSGAGPPAPDCLVAEWVREASAAPRAEPWSAGGGDGPTRARPAAGGGAPDAGQCLALFRDRPPPGGGAGAPCRSASPGLSAAEGAHRAPPLGQPQAPPVTNISAIDWTEDDYVAATTGGGPARPDAPPTGAVTLQRTSLMPVPQGSLQPQYMPGLPLCAPIRVAGPQCSACLGGVP